MDRRRIRNFALGGLAGVVLVALIGAGGFPSRPIFQQATVRQTVPSYRLLQTDATATNQAWRIVAAGEQLVLNTCTDTFSSCPVDALKIDRTGTTIDRLTLAGTVLGTTSASAIAGTFEADNTQPGYGLAESDAAADNIQWLDYVNAGVRHFSVWNDAGSVTSDFLTATRSGTTITSVNLQGTAVQANGLPIATQILCSSACSGAALTVGQSLLATKDAESTLSSDATLNTDDDLSVTNLPIGGYAAELFAVLDAPSASGGSQLGVIAAGSDVDANDGSGVRNCNSTGTTLIAQFTTTAAFGSCGIDEGAFRFEFVLSFSSTGSFAVQWAQATSFAETLVLRRRSYLKLTRLY